MDYKTMQECWTKWEPISSLSNKYYIQSVVDNFDERFQIILYDIKNEKNKILLSFPNSVNAYRYTDETFTLLTIDYLNKTYGSNFYAYWTFFKVENSRYLNSIAENSLGIAEPPYYNFIHYSIITDDGILDIACTYEPTVTFLD